MGFGTATHSIATTYRAGHVESILFVLWTMFWFTSLIKDQLIHGTLRRRLTICKLQLFYAMQHLWMEWNSHKFVADGLVTGPFDVEYIGA